MKIEQDHFGVDLEVSTVKGKVANDEVFFCLSVRAKVLDVDVGKG